MAKSSQYDRDAFGQGGLNDRLDADALLDEIGLDREEVRWRKDFVGFDDDDVERLTKYHDAFQTHADQVAEDFYDNLTDYEETVEIIGRSEKSVAQLKRTQSAYLTTLARGDYGLDYFHDRARIGKIHDMLDMPMKHYLGQYGVYYDLILPLVGDRLTESLTDRLADDAGVGEDRETVASAVREEVDDAIRDILAILRIVNLDMQVVTDTYIHSYSQRLERELDRQRDVAGDIDTAISETEDVAQDIAVSTEEISDVARSQAESMEDVAGEVANMSATVEEIASTADEVAATSEHAERLADEGRDAADEASSAMGRVDDSIGDVADDIAHLQERVEEIDDVVDVINDIAEQTNLLALNASIEAARAGEAGEGFAVVADEVKSLAEESQDHAGDIEEMVDEIQTVTSQTVEGLEQTTGQVNDGREQVENAMATLQEIADAVEDASRGMQEVSAATDDQAASTEEVASMVDELVEQAELVADEIEDIAAANEEQAAQVQRINETVGRLSTE